MQTGNYFFLYNVGAGSYMTVWAADGQSGLRVRTDTGVSSPRVFRAVLASNQSATVKIQHNTEMLLQVWDSKAVAWFGVDVSDMGNTEKCFGNKQYVYATPSTSKALMRFQFRTTQAKSTTAPMAFGATQFLIGGTEDIGTRLWLACGEGQAYVAYASQASLDDAIVFTAEQTTDPALNVVPGVPPGYEKPPEYETPTPEKKKVPWLVWVGIGVCVAFLILLFAWAVYSPATKNKPSEHETEPAEERKEVEPMREKT